MPRPIACVRARLPEKYSHLGELYDHLPQSRTHLGLLVRCDRHQELLSVTRFIQNPDWQTVPVGLVIGNGFDVGLELGRFPIVFDPILRAADGPAVPLPEADAARLVERTILEELFHDLKAWTGDRIDDPKDEQVLRTIAEIGSTGGGLKRLLHQLSMSQTALYDWCHTRELPGPGTLLRVSRHSTVRILDSHGFSRIASIQAAGWMHPEAYAAATRRLSPEARTVVDQVVAKAGKAPTGARTVGSSVRIVG